MKASDLVPHWYCVDPLLPTPVSETHESLSNGRQQVAIRNTTRKMVNFQSYHRNDYTRKAIEGTTGTEKKIKHGKYVSQYVMDYPTHFPISRNLPTDNFVDPLFNRIPKNGFVISKDSEHKFMDDFLILSNPHRLKIDFMRQMSKDKAATTTTNLDQQRQCYKGENNENATTTTTMLEQQRQSYKCRGNCDYETTAKEVVERQNGNYKSTTNEL
uniref:Uncharacterized protein n=1 Tax=Glossina austeni TaxID=7395 RepID=A0A1A9UIL2_GLOAU